MASSRTPAGGLPDDTYRQSLDNGDQMVLSTLRLRSRSLFCLEPVGLNPGRKSQIDAILSGCIPVLVFPRQVYDSFLSYHFRWREHASVHIEPDDILQGRVDLREKLVGLNASGAARSMQRAIARHARSLVYSIDGAMPGDAVDTLVRALPDALDQPPGSTRPCTDALQPWRCQDETLPVHRPPIAEDYTEDDLQRRRMLARLQAAMAAGRQVRALELGRRSRQSRSRAGYRDDTDRT
jgi:hypothetical protein